MWQIWRELRAGEIDLIVVSLGCYAPWNYRRLKAIFTRPFGRKSLVRIFGVHALRFPCDYPPILAIDSEDSRTIERHNQFLLDKSKYFFKRELPMDRWEVFQHAPYAGLPDPRFRSNAGIGCRDRKPGYLRFPRECKCDLFNMNSSAARFCLLRNWREMFLYGVLLRKLGVRVRPTAVLRFRSGLEIEMVPGGYGGYTILFQDIFIRRDYQPTPEFVVRDGWTVLDIGANMGFFTCQAASSAKDVRVVAVEPVGPYIKVLRANIKRNHFQQVTVIQAAAAPRSGSKIPLLCGTRSSAS